VTRAAALLALTGCLDYGFDKEGPHELDPDTSPVDLCTDPGLDPAPVDVAAPCTPDRGGDGFEPTIEWSYGPGRAVRATVAVGDLDGDGAPEIVANVTGLLPTSTGDLVAIRGDGTELWSAPDQLGFGTSPALADLDGDGSPEIVAVREYARALFEVGDYAAVAWDAQGQQVWESEHFTDGEFDYASGPAVADLDHDGSPEVVVGRAILNADGPPAGSARTGAGPTGSSTSGACSWRRARSRRSPTSTSTGPRRS
jgi:hypothetical protein